MYTEYKELQFGEALGFQHTIYLISVLSVTSFI